MIEQVEEKLTLNPAVFGGNKYEQKLTGRQVDRIERFLQENGFNISEKEISKW